MTTELSDGLDPTPYRGLPDHRWGELAAPRALRSSTICFTRSAACWGFSCSQTLMLSHPASASRWSVSRSRARFPSTLSDQNFAFVTATVWCCGQPCQKQPSKKTATRAELNTKSAVRRRPGSGRLDTRYLRPSRCTAERRASSGLVSRPLLERILARTPGDDAQDSVTAAPPFGVP